MAVPGRRSVRAWKAAITIAGLEKEATVDDLLRVNGKAEIVNGKLVLDYIAAGTKVVWDVDVLREELIRVYRADDPEHPTIYHRGEVAEAEPAVLGWRFPVDELWDD